LKFEKYQQLSNSFFNKELHNPDFLLLMRLCWSKVNHCWIHINIFVIKNIKIVCWFLEKKIF